VQCGLGVFESRFMTPEYYGNLTIMWWEKKLLSTSSLSTFTAVCWPDLGEILAQTGVLILHSLVADASTFFIAESFINTYLDHVQTKSEKIFM